MNVLPVTAVIPTRNRAESLRKTFESLLNQKSIPSEVIVVDGSEGKGTEEVVQEFQERALGRCDTMLVKAKTLGAAIQRNQGVALATQPWIWFIDDDIFFEPHCVDLLWDAAQSDPNVGGVNALITNQQYRRPRLVSRFVFALMAGRHHKSYAGMVLGPAVNLLPEDNATLPEIVPVEWLNTTCALYRRGALPTPPFDSVFTGYSLMEDLTLSLRVGAKWRIVNARTARIFHDSQPGSHKNDLRALSAMELANRYYVMTQVLKRKSILNYLRLVFWELFQLVALARSNRSPRIIVSSIAGKLIALRTICIPTTSAR